MGAMKQLYTEQQEARMFRGIPRHVLEPNDPRLHRAALALYIELRLQRNRWINAGAYGYEDAVASIDRALARVE